MVSVVFAGTSMKISVVMLSLFSSLSNQVEGSKKGLFKGEKEQTLVEAF